MGGVYGVFVLIGFGGFWLGGVLDSLFGVFSFCFFLCVLGMYLPIIGTLNMKCQPFLHFLPQISDVQRMSNCLHSQTGEKKKKITEQN